MARNRIPSTAGILLIPWVWLGHVSVFLDLRKVVHRVETVNADPAMRCSHAEMGQNWMPQLVQCSLRIM
jgi:hypothetical protein